MPTYYTTQREMEDVFGEDGFNNRMDDVDPQDFTTTLDHIREDATDLINSYIQSRYDATELTTSRWIRRRTTFIACYLLSRRRGNSPQFMQEYEEARGDLEEVRDGQLIVPGIATRSDLTPVMSNLVMDSRTAGSQMRVQANLSVGGSYGEQYVAFSLPYQWL